LQVFGGDGNDRLLDRNGYSGEAFWGNAGNDYIEAGSGDEGCLADGGVGNDVLKSLGGVAVYLRGGMGSDKLYASADDSVGVLNGGGGKDRLFCDTAQDTLAFFTNHSGVGAARDVVYRFDEDDDLIDLAGMDANRGVGGNQEFGWYGEVDGPSEVAVGGVGYYRSGEDLIVAGNNGIRFEIELDGLAGHALNTDDFML
jgi:serralysin